MKTVLDDDVIPAPMHKLMGMCWDEDPSIRPQFTAIKAYIRRNNRNQYVKVL
jgi:hypothetical protein